MMAMPHVEPTVIVYRGDTTIFLDIGLKEGPTGAEVDINFTQWTLTSHWRPTKTSDEFMVLTVTGTSVGKLLVVASDAQTRLMTKKGVWDVEGVKAGTGEVRTFAVGTSFVIDDVTRA